MTGSADRSGRGGGAGWPEGEYPPAPEAGGEWSRTPGVPRQYPDGQQYPEGQQYPGQYGHGQAQQPYDPYAGGTPGYDTGTGQYPAYGYQGGYDTGTGQYPAYGYQGGYDTGTGQQPAYGYQGGYDTGTGQYPAQPQYGGYDPSAGGGHPGYGGQDGPDTGQQPGYGRYGGYDTGETPVAAPPEPPAPAAPAAPAGRGGGQPPRGGKGEDYRSDEFAFVDDEEESNDVIDWLKFSETRGERRDERRRRIRNRLVSLAVVLVLAAGGGVGYLFASGKLSLGGSAGSGGAAGPAQREVVAVYLRNHVSGQTATALLVDDPATHRGTTVLLPDTLQLPQGSGGSALRLGDSWDAQGTSGTQDGLGTVLGTQVTGTWRLDDSFLATLVDVLGGVTVDADTAVVQNGKQVVPKGSQTMNGSAAEAYATYQAKGETRGAQLARFGQVMAAVVKAFPADTASAVADVDRMGAVLDPSLPEKALGGLLARLSTDSAKGGYRTVTLPVSSSGALGGGAAAMVQGLLGGTARGSAGGATAARVLVESGSSSAKALGLARAAVENGGYTLVSGGGSPGAQAKTRVLYADAARKGDAQQIAQDLGLPASAAVKGSVPQTADVLVVLGSDYQG